MPDHGPNNIQPAFQKNLDALRNTAPTLHTLLTDILLLNDRDRRLRLSTATNAHVYAGRYFLLRVEFRGVGCVTLHRDTTKAVEADALMDRAPKFYASLAKAVMQQLGFKNQWAEEDRRHWFLTLRANTPGAFIPVALSLVEAELTTLP